MYFVFSVFSVNSVAISAFKADILS